MMFADKKKDEKAAAEEELSDEDLKLKEELELCVERLTENDEKLYSAALSSLRKVTSLPLKKF